LYIGTDIAYIEEIYIMNVKRTFGTILTILGIIGLIYAGYGFSQHEPQTRQLIVFGIIGVIFFFSGIGLVKNTKDEA
jgi:uncharacterized membrane protein